MSLMCRPSRSISKPCASLPVSLMTSKLPRKPITAADEAAGNSARVAVTASTVDLMRLIGIFLKNAR